MKKKDYVVLNLDDGSWFFACDCDSREAAIEECVKSDDITKSFECEVVEVKNDTQFCVTIQPSLVIEKVE